MCFATREDTGIPALQEWCHTLILPLHEEAARNLLERLRAFIQSFRAFMEESHPGLSDKDREAIMKQWRSATDGFPDEDFNNRVLRDIKAKRQTSGVLWRLIKVRPG